MSRTTKNRKAADYLSRAPNYSGEAIASLRVEAERRRSWSLDGAEHFRDIADRLEEAHKFILPVNGRLFDETQPWQIESWRLPFPVAAFEFELAPKTKFSEGDGKTRRAITLAWEWESRDGRKGCWLVGLRHFENRGGWVLEPWQGFVDQDRHVEKASYEGTSQRFELRGVSLIGFSRFKDAKWSPRVDAQCTNDLMLTSAFGGFLTGLSQVCAALACTNVTTEVIRPNREARAARPASTLFDYHVLMIDPSKEQNPSEDHGGTHASPRTHLRRGHIRRLAWGPRVWVNSCVVNPGAVGTVNKDYAVKRGGN